MYERGYLRTRTGRRRVPSVFRHGAELFIGHLRPTTWRRAINEAECGSEGRSLSDARAIEPGGRQGRLPTGRTPALPPHGAARELVLDGSRGAPLLVGPREFLPGPKSKFHYAIDASSHRVCAGSYIAKYGRRHGQLKWAAFAIALGAGVAYVSSHPEIDLSVVAALLRITR